MAEKKYTYEIKLDINRDAKNWWEACNRTSHGVDWGERIDAHLLKNIRGKSETEAYVFLIPFLKKRYKKDNTIIEKFIKETSLYFEKYFSQACEKMAQVTGKPLYRDKFTIYLTTFPRGPYNKSEGSMLVYLGWGQPLKSFLHELCHFQFIHYWGENNDEEIMNLSQEEFEYLKESLTVVIDKSFFPMIQSIDNGYPLHREFRDALLKQWQSNKNFNDLIHFGIKELLKQRR